MSRQAAGDPFDALSDPHRREILRLLGQGDKPVRELAAALPISRPAVSRHLKLLRRAGLVTDRAEGTRRIYHLDGAGLRDIQGYLETVWGEAAARFRLLADNSTDPPSGGPGERVARRPASTKADDRRPGAAARRSSDTPGDRGAGR